ncbi:hypothetical protein SDC9_135269 [bioreactor metagenome]|uniref:Uncharacterized protein n=1 Tax=bioreactor metagenome TaxID=1076179 RepID=A0A645DGK1_9ZZZZ
MSRHGEDSAGIIHITADVSDQMSLKSAFEKISSEERGIDLLINNAGIGISGSAENTEYTDAMKQIKVNFIGMYLCCSFAMPLLRNNKGRIINLSSVAAVLPIPFQSFYSASKGAINAFSLALRNEVRDFGISVCAVMPGDVCTGFTDARIKSSKGNEVYESRIGRSVSVMEHDEKNGMSAEYAARKIFDISQKRNVAPLYTIGNKYKLLVFISRFLPVSAINRIVYSLYSGNSK